MRRLDVPRSAFSLTCLTRIVEDPALGLLRTPINVAQRTRGVLDFRSAIRARAAGLGSGRRWRCSRRCWRGWQILQCRSVQWLQGCRIVDLRWWKPRRLNDDRRATILRGRDFAHNEKTDSGRTDDSDYLQHFSMPHIPKRPKKLHDV